MAIKQDIEMSVGEIKSFGYLIGALSRSVESDPDTCVWSVLEGTSISITNSLLSSSTATVTLEADEIGCTIIKGALTFDDGQIVNLFFHVIVSNPEC
jgi:hypothetical protein